MWTQFQTHYFAANVVDLGNKPRSFASVAKDSDQQTTETVENTAHYIVISNWSHGDDYDRSQANVCAHNLSILDVSFNLIRVELIVSRVITIPVYILYSDLQYASALKIFTHSALCWEHAKAQWLKQYAPCGRSRVRDSRKWMKFISLTNPTCPVVYSVVNRHQYQKQ